MLAEGAALAEARRLIVGWLGDPKLRVRTHDRASGADLTAEFGRLRLVVEYNATGSAAVVGSAISQARRHAEQLGRGALPVVAVGHMGESGRRLCAAAGVSWFDLSGNAHIVGPGLLVHVEGKPNKFSQRGRPSTVFAPRSARVARLLLLDPRRAFRQQDLSRESGLDDGFVSRIVHRLEDDGLVRRGEDGSLTVVDPNLLLDAWAEVYDFTKHTITKGHVTAPAGEKLLAQVSQTFSKSKFRHAATGLAAAWLHTSFAGFRLATFFVEKLPGERLLREIGFREEAKGANLWLVVPNDEGVLLGAEARDDIPCVHPVQTYLDLQAQPERATEAAGELRSRLLNWKSR